MEKPIAVGDELWRVRWVLSDKLYFDQWRVERLTRKLAYCHDERGGRWHLTLDTLADIRGDFKRTRREAVVAFMEKEKEQAERAAALYAGVYSACVTALAEEAP